MAIELRSAPVDKHLEMIGVALEKYSGKHPKAKISAYRQNSVSVRIRVIDPNFKGMSRAGREEDFWGVLKQLPEDVVAEISVLLLLTPDEAKKSFANVEFDDPVSSKL